MPTREKLTENFSDIDEQALLMDGFDEACIGYSQRINGPVLAVYSYDKMVEVLMNRDGMDYDEASEFIDYNCVGAWIGERTPIIAFSFDTPPPFGPLPSINEDEKRSPSISKWRACYR